VLGATNSWLHAQTSAAARFDKDRGYVCTFSALIFKGRDVHLLHVGDARIYRLHAQALEQLTDDHRVHVSSQSLPGPRAGHRPQRRDRLPQLARWRSARSSAGHRRRVCAPRRRRGARRARALRRDFDDAARRSSSTRARRAATTTARCNCCASTRCRPPMPRSCTLQRAGLAIAPALAPRDRFEGFTIVRELHVSSRSHVHLAVDDATGQQVVLKLPSVDLRDDPDYLDRFVLEEWVARRVDSVHVLKASASSGARAPVRRHGIRRRPDAGAMDGRPPPARAGRGARHRRADWPGPAGAAPARRCCTRTCGPRT
jgi:hypothetical protein